MNFWTRIAEVEGLLAELFPEAESSEISNRAKLICNSNSYAKALEAVQRRDRNPALEIENLRKAARQISSASGHLRQLGNYGGIAMKGLAQQLKTEISSAGEALEVVPEFLKRMSERLEEAADQISHDLPTGGLGSDANSSAGAKRKVAAEFTSRECYDAYHSLSGLRPTITTSPARGSNASGPFLDFVASIFEILEIDASPETWCRHWVKERLKEKT